MIFDDDATNAVQQIAREMMRLHGDDALGFALNDAEIATRLRDMDAADRWWAVVREIRRIMAY